MDLLEPLAYAAVGVAAGALSGMFGVGGAVVTTPAIRALGVSPILAVGSTIPAILPAALSGAHRYATEDLVEWRIALTCGLTGAALAVAGAWVSDQVDARWLMVLTAALLLWSGVNAIGKARAEARSPGAATGPAPATTPPGAASGAGLAVDATSIAVATAIDAEPATPSFAALALVGTLAGFVAGLLGVGGGIVMMPLFTSVLRLPVKVAVASSLVAVAIFSVPALVSHVLLGHVDWAVALGLVVGTVPGARLGSHLALQAQDATMRMLLGIFFCVAAVVYGASELNAIL